MTITLSPERQAKVAELKANDAKAAKRYLASIAGKTNEWHGEDNAARLVQAADCYGMTVNGVMRHEDLLAHFNLTRSDAEAVSGKASRLVRDWEENIQNRVRRLNRGRGVVEEFKTTTTKKAKPAKKEKPAPKAKDAFGSREGSGSYKLNATVLEGGATTAAEMSKQAEVTLSRAKAHVKWLLDRDFITGNADGFTIVEDFVPAAKRQRKSRVQYAIWDINCCSIIRWMGQEGWDFDSAALAVETLGCRGMSDATMKLHLTAGRKGDKRWGEPAKLTSYQKKALAKAAE